MISFLFPRSGQVRRGVRAMSGAKRLGLHTEMHLPRARLLRFGGCAALLAVAATRTALAQSTDTVVAYGVANFGDVGQCGSANMSHAVHTETAAAFLAAFTELRGQSLWYRCYRANNEDCRGSYWTDSSKAGSCGCNGNDLRPSIGADADDVLYIHTHGGHVNSVRSYLAMGNSAAGEDCYVDTDNNMLFNGDLDIAVVKACQSGQLDVFQAGGYRARFTTASSSFTMWNAFHGDSSCGSHVTDYVRSYAAESTYNGVGDNWIDEAYDDDGAEGDDCPVSIVMGATAAACENMYEYGGWLDRTNTGNKNTSVYYFISGCNPDNANALP